MPETATAVREITFGEAIKEAIAEEMRRDPRVVLMGEDVAEAGTTFGVLKGLVDGSAGPHHRRADSGSRFHRSRRRRRHDRHAPDRDIMFGDFLMIIMDQVANQPRSTTCRAASGKCRSSFSATMVRPPVSRAALAVAPRVARPHSRRRWLCPRRPTTPGLSSPRFAMTTLSSFRHKISYKRSRPGAGGVNHSSGRHDEARRARSPSSP